MANFENFNIKVPYGSTGNIKAICPACTPHNRKPEHRNSKDLSVNITEGIWNCHNCGWKGTIREKTEKTYSRPVEVNLPMSQRAIDWFKSRGIKESTLKAFAISEKMEFMPQEGKEVNCILFPYRRNGEWINVKYRSASKKFKLTKDAELIMFNMDAIQGKKKVIITEGEIDAMTVHEVGFFDVCSVPNGASKGSNRLDYLDNSWLAFTDAEEIIIATDKDEPGFALKNELARRLGKERCKDIVYPDDCKDLNEVLIKHGNNRVWECIKGAKSFPVDGVYRLNDFMAELDNVYEHGFTPGVKIGYSEFDNFFNFSTGQLTLLTGVPNSGKSAFLDQILIRLAEKHNWRIGVNSFENQPITRHAGNLAACYTGQSFYGKDKMNVQKYNKAKEFLYDHFYWFKMKDEDLSLDGILSRAKQLVKAYGINALVIDPYNYMEHKRPFGVTETEYISQILTTLSNFCKDYDVHTFLVAHPTKIKKSPITKDFEVPTLYDVAGSAHFFNKADNGITVYRERATNIVTVYIQKVRFFFNGKLGNCNFNYNVYTGQYTQVTNEPEIQPLQPQEPPDNPRAGITNNQRQLPIETEDLPF